MQPFREPPDKKSGVETFSAKRFGRFVIFSKYFNHFNFFPNHLEYVCQRILSLFEALSKRYYRLVATLQGKKKCFQAKIAQCTVLNTGFE